MKKFSLVIVTFFISVSLYAGQSVRGNTYSGIDSDGDNYVYEFLNDGKLKYTSPSGTYTNGSWQQYETAIYIQRNEHYVDCVGMVGKESLKFKCWNVKNNFWIHEVKKSKSL